MKAISRNFIPLCLFHAIAFLSSFRPAFADSILFEEIHGEVHVLKKGMEDWVAADQEAAIEEGDEVKTGNRSEVHLKMPRGLVTLEENTRLEVKKFQSSSDQMDVSLALMVGKLKALVHKASEDQKFEIVTPTSVASVRGTFFAVWVYQFLGKWSTRLDVYEGTATFFDNIHQKTVEVTAGEHRTSTQDEAEDAFAAKEKPKPALEFEDAEFVPASTGGGPMLIKDENSSKEVSGSEAEEK